MCILMYFIPTLDQGRQVPAQNKAACDMITNHRVLRLSQTRSILPGA